LRTINAASPAKLKVELATGGKLKLTDLTAGIKAFQLSGLNGSQALIDLGLDVSGVGGVITGQTINAPQGSINAGIGVGVEDRITDLIDPVTGAITRESDTLDQRTLQFQDRIAQLDKILE